MAGDGPCSWENIWFWLLQKRLDLSRRQRKTFCFCCQRSQLEMTWLPVEISDFVTTNTAGNVQLSLNIRGGVILCLGVKRLVRSMLPPLVGSGSQAWATECMLTINFKVCTYSGLLCCWLEVLLLLFWFTVPTETSTFVHNNVQVMKVAPSKSVSGKSQRHWHCLSIYGDTEQHHNQQR